MSSRRSKKSGYGDAFLRNIFWILGSEKSEEGLVKMEDWKPHPTLPAGEGLVCQRGNFCGGVSEGRVSEIRAYYGFPANWGFSFILAKVDGRFVRFVSISDKNGYRLKFWGFYFQKSLPFLFAERMNCCTFAVVKRRKITVSH